MGIKATVVYDIVRHTTVVVRTKTVSITERYEVIDTIASFSEHCESLRGTARSAIEVSAAWGGPPYVTYSVVASRFLVIVIWDQRAAEFDLAHDVEECLMRLETAVASVKEPLVGRRSDAVAKVYEEAGYALHGEVPILLSDMGSEGKKPPTRPKLLSRPSGLPRRSSVAEPRKKKSGGSGRLLGKFGNALKSVKSSGADEQKGVILNSQRPHSAGQDSTSSSRPPSESGASLASYGKGNGMPFDEAVGELELSEEVFAWANFGGDVPQNAGDLSWFLQLIHSDEGLVSRPRPPMLRSGHSPSTPLTISSRDGPLSQGTKSEESSVVNSEEPIVLPPHQDAAQTAAPAVLSPSSVPSLQASRESEPVQASPAAVSPEVRAGQRPTQGTPQQMIATMQQQIASRTGVQPSTLQGAPGRQMPLSQVQQSPQAYLPHAAGLSQGAAPGMVAGQGASSLSTIPPSTGSSRPSVPSVQTPRTDVSSPRIVTSASGQQLPPALAELNRPSDFDVAGLGGYKDEAAQSSRSSLSGRSNGQQMAQDNDETIRSRMNEFAVTMQAGNFTLALQQVFSTLKLLRSIQPRRERETITCSNYVLAQKILIRNAVLETELARVQPGTAEGVRRHIEMALLTMFLAELKHLLPRHRVAAMKVAVDKNFIVGNYGMCARWLKLLVEKAPEAQKDEFRQRLEVCVRNGERNAQMPPTNRLCYITLQVLLSPYGKCGVCGAVYHAQMAGVTAGQVCPTCFVGAVEAKM